MRGNTMDPRYNAFYLLTGGITFVAFGLSFGPCLFDLNTVDACVAVAEGWVDVLKGVGDHIIAWATAFIKAAFR